MRLYCPSPSPLQARLAASLSTLLLLGIIYWVISRPQTAYASEIDWGTGDGSDHNRHSLERDDQQDTRAQDVNGRARALMVARADTQIIDSNDSPNRGNLTSGQTILWLYSLQLLQTSALNQETALPSDLQQLDRSHGMMHVDLREPAGEIRASSYTVYISINTCSQPTWVGQGTQTTGPAQLTMYVGTSSSVSVGPGGSSTQDEVILDEGFASIEMDSAIPFYIAVSAPTLSANFTGSWTYDLAVSHDDYYHASNDDVQFLYLADTDLTSALLVTEDLTTANASSAEYNAWLSLPQPLPFTVFANADNTKRLGLSRSYCGLQNVAQVGSTRNGTNGSPYIVTSMVTRSLKNGPKQQFMIGNLTAASTYNATLALVGNGVRSGKGVVGGGGTVWQTTNWTTKADGNCRLISDLSFCNDVAYAVPAHPANTTQEIKTFYDQNATQLYQNFSYSLQQIQCNTSNDQRYSLARGCDDCANAYKQWLCAVVIPRCADFSSTASYLQPRNVAQPIAKDNSSLPDDLLNTPYIPMPGAPTLPGSPIQQTWLWSFSTNQSRNPAIVDQQFYPGPYKEVLPCEDICYNLVQSCPAALQFSCPGAGRGLEVGYAQRRSQSNIECNFPGAVYYIDAAEHLIPHIATVLSVVVLLSIIMTL